MSFKTKGIRKERAGGAGVGRKAGELRKRLKMQLVSPRFAGWLGVLQAFRRETVYRSESFRQAVRECRDLSCPVCYCLMLLPVVLACGHAFCRPCIEQATLLQDRCCICRAPNALEHFAVCPTTNALVLAVAVGQLGGEERQFYEQRRCEYAAWQRLTMISPEFRLGELVHFYDHDGHSPEPQKGWRCGVVTRVTVRRGADAFLEVQPLIFRR